MASSSSQHLFVFVFRHGQIWSLCLPPSICLSSFRCDRDAQRIAGRDTGRVLSIHRETRRGSDRKMAVRCTGEGVPFVEAMSEDDIGMLGDISIIDLPMLRKLMNNSDGAQTILEKTFADSVVYRIIRVTAFKCGGITLGILINHVVIDGKALTDFITCWTDVARAKPLSIRPFLDRLVLCPR
ncbi:fatty alcohol:caffeoyl-CoA acyltransferase-like [Eucalyptus grandis]|uniref:fatty alcohol:caffeoyl-CoA acyltransferase-like n=1 Tax=Eucalyptus grandis TaxID=71139 RepID=UPI00192EC59C|nr:fatty alcohol:caffeoyl-CoA acyltransferase-like [Eucalyptus grandis]